MSATAASELQAHQTSDQASREKQSAAFWSVVAAIALTGMKLAVGFATGSLGILAEAAHSALDLVAAIVTFVAVRMADRPADLDHPYGHKRVENLSALFETLLLLVTCVWIVREAVERLRHGGAEVEASYAAFAVIAISIVIDVNRSRNLQRMADKHKSQALEADALHFSTDVWSSCVVLAGLACVKAGELLAMPRLALADPLAALGVSAIVVYVSLRLGRKSMDALLDRAPEGLRGRIDAAARAVPGVLDCYRIRLREAGDGIFLDLTVAVERHTDLEAGHRIADLIEARVRAFEPKADIVVHLEPLPGERETLVERVRVLAQRMGLAVHNVAVLEQEAGLRIEMHLEVDESLDLAAAHGAASALEARIRDEHPGIAAIETHIESRRLHESRPAREADGATELGEEARRIAMTVPGVAGCHDVAALVCAQRVSLTMHCTFPGATSIDEVHRLSTAIERRVTSAMPRVERVLVHAEPAEELSPGPA